MHVRPPCQTSELPRLCANWKTTSFPGEAPPHDPRVKAAVIVDPHPALPSCLRTNLKGCDHSPSNRWSFGPIAQCPTIFPGCCAAQINQRLPSKPEYYLHKNAKHLSFLATCSPEETRAALS